MSETHEEYKARKRAYDIEVLSGRAEPPACYTCGVPSTYVSDGITPAGHRAYQCKVHAGGPKMPLWGSDPGWPVEYEPLEVVRQKFKKRTV